MTGDPVVRLTRRWQGMIVAALALIVLLVMFGDREAASLSHAAFGEPGQGGGAKRVFIALTHLVDPIVPLAMLGLFGFGAAMTAGDGRRPRIRGLLVACVATLVAMAAKDELKFAFGRLWPETWVNNNPSFIGGGAYGFAPFHGGPGWSSFPSGHMTLITAPMAILMRAAPAWRWAAATPIVLVAIGLYGADYHFLSDMVAGTLLGAVCAALVWAALGSDRHP